MIALWGGKDESSFPSEGGKQQPFDSLFLKGFEDLGLWDKDSDGNSMQDPHFIHSHTWHLWLSSSLFPQSLCFPTNVALR